MHLFLVTCGANVVLIRDMLTTRANLWIIHTLIGSGDPYEIPRFTHCICIHNTSLHTSLPPLQSLLAPITDLHYRHLVEDLDRSFMREDIKLRIEASKMAIVALLKSWPGVYCLCSPSNNGLGSLLEMLPLSKPEVQREILDLFYSVFQLKVPEWTDSFTDAVISIGRSETICCNSDFFFEIWT